MSLTFRLISHQLCKRPHTLILKRNFIVKTLIKLPEVSETFDERLKVLNLKGKDLEIEAPVNIGFARPQFDVPDRAQKAHLLKENKRNPELSKLARSQKLNICLEEVRKCWHKENGPEDIKKVAEHYGIYESLFKHGFFYPYVPLTVHYDSSDEYLTPVYRGNIIYPKEATKPPIVNFESKPDDLWTLILTNPDGHLEDNDAEYIHWFVGNIKGGDLATGETIVDYLQPFPYLGSGYHRYIFILYKQEKLMNFDSFRKEQPCLNLPDRTFRTFDFYKSHQEDLTPASLAFFQSVWDLSLRDFFHYTLKMAAPHFEYLHPPEYLAEQVDYPHKEPFNLYLDKYRDPKDLRKDVFLKRLKELVHPFKEDEPPKSKLPNIMTISESREIPQWQRADSWKQRNRIGRYRELEPYSVYPRPPFEIWRGKGRKSNRYDELGQKRDANLKYWDDVVEEEQIK